MSDPVPRRGVFAALWLPTDHKGALLTSALADNIAFLREHGVTGLLALGSTGEFPQLDVRERQGVLATVVKLAGDMPIIANISDIRPRVVAELGRCARDLDVAAVAIMAPGFYPSTQDDLLAHLLHAADSAQLPTMLYNFPELTGTRIEPKTVVAFAQRAPMLGIKQSGGEFAYHRELIALGREHDFSVFSGADTRLPEVFALGADGCIGGLVNLAPDLMVHLYRVCKLGEPGAVSPAFEQLKRIGDQVNRLPFPFNVGVGMRARGLTAGEPKGIVSEASRTLAASVEPELRQWFEDWGLEPASAGMQRTR